MPKQVMPLTDTTINKAKPKDKDYQLSDGGGFSLLITKDGGKWWRFNYVSPIDGKRKLISFGVYPDVTLLRARELRSNARQKVADGIDPSNERKETMEAIKKQGLTFEAVALEFIDKKIKEGKKKIKEEYGIEITDEYFRKHKGLELELKLWVEQN